MANEITISAGLSTTIGGTTISSNRSKILDITGNEALSALDSVGFASDQAIPLSSLDNVGQLLIENLDASNFVQVSSATGGSFAASVFMKVRPGCCALIQPNTATLYIKADTAACAVKYTAVEV